jgi:hypothetical protein
MRIATMSNIGAVGATMAIEEGCEIQHLACLGRLRVETVKPRVGIWQQQ